MVSEAGAEVEREFSTPNTASNAKCRVDAEPMILNKGKPPREAGG
jgi:hypothetical protein